MGAYAAQRDRPINRALRLSPYLRHGELHPPVWTAAINSEARDGKFLAKLIWREFATQQLVLHPSLPDRPRGCAVRAAALA